LLWIVSSAYGLPRNDENEREVLAFDLAYVDAEERRGVKDVEHQNACYNRQGLVKREVDPSIVIDKRYAVPMTPPRWQVMSGTRRS